MNENTIDTPTHEGYTTIRDQFQYSLEFHRERLQTIKTLLDRVDTGITLRVSTPRELNLLADGLEILEGQSESAITDLSESIKEIDTYLEERNNRT